MARMHIYVSDDLAERMDSASKETNWSRLAQEAFELEITRQQATREVKDMSDVVERLRASKGAYINRLTRDAYANGITWAKQEASYEQLKSLFEQVEQLSSSIGIGDHLSCLRFAIYGLEYDTEGWMDFCKRNFGKSILPEDEAVTNFINGACFVWKEVADQL